MKKAIFLFIFFFILAPLHAEVSTAGIVKKMEARRGRWTSLHGFLRMNFSTSQGKSAQCRAELYYNRMEEEIILKGFRENQELLFIFKTNDRNFRLYLPKQKTEFHGTIFDMEDSPDIHSHLKALDLYRALKPGLLRPDNITAEEGEHGLTMLKTQTVFTQRQVWVNVQGDALKEQYGSGGKLKTEIGRSAFKKISLEGKDDFYYPYEISIKSAAPAGAQQTELVFESVDFELEYKSKFPELIVPEGTQTYDVNQKLERFFTE